MSEVYLHVKTQILAWKAFGTASVKEIYFSAL